MGLRYAFICLQLICVLCLAATAGRRVGLAVLQQGQIRWGLCVITAGEEARGNEEKLEGVGPVNNRPSTNYLHHFVKKEEEKKGDM